jgi:DNA-binding transcriptional ArsR family regulator
MKPVKVIKDPEAFQLVADQTRRKIVFLLRVKEMTVSQMAAELNITPQAVYHHIKKLQKADMVEVAREERIDHIIESYYRATAETFFCSFGETPRTKELAVEQMKTVLNALKKLGFNVRFNNNDLSKLTEIQREHKALKECCGSETLEDAIADLDDVDFLTKQVVKEYAETLSMPNDKFLKQQRLRKEFRDLLMSLTNAQNSAE